MVLLSVFSEEYLNGIVLELIVDFDELIKIVYGYDGFYIF